MPGIGRPVNPVWLGVGAVIGAVLGIYLHQLWAGLAIGAVLAGALSLIREDARRGYRRPFDHVWFVFGLAIGLIGGVGLHYLGLDWKLGLGLGLAAGLFIGAAVGTIREDTRRNR